MAWSNIPLWVPLVAAILRWPLRDILPLVILVVAIGAIGVIGVTPLDLVAEWVAANLLGG